MKALLHQVGCISVYLFFISHKYFFVDNVICELLTNHVDKLVSDERVLKDQKLDEIQHIGLLDDGDVHSNLIEFTPKELNFKER